MKSVCKYGNLKTNLQVRPISKLINSAIVEFYSTDIKPEASSIV